MSVNRKISIANLAIYLALFAAHVIFIGGVKADIGEIAGDVTGGPNYTGLVVGVWMILAMLILIVCGTLMIVNIILKALQISFDKWGFSVPSIVLDSLMVLWTGKVAISYLSGAGGYIAVICVVLFIVEVGALILECANILNEVGALILECANILKKNA